jgi:hypothetical protein
MANVKISGLPAASTLTGAELVPVVQSGVTSQTTLAAMPYVPAGTGAVTTTVQAKLRESVSVFDFMTAAQIADVQARTASVDVTAAIKTAILAVQAVGGGIVYFPSGIYLLNGEAGADGIYHGVNVPYTGAGITAGAKGIILQGAGADSILKANHANMMVVRWSDNNGVMRDMAIQGNSTSSGLVLCSSNTTSSTPSNGITFNTFSNLTIGGCGGDGIRLQCPLGANNGVYYNNFNDCYIYFDVSASGTVGGRGIYLYTYTGATGSQNRNKFSGIRFQRLNTGIEIQDGDTNTFYSCTFEDVQKGTSPNTTPTAIKIGSGIVSTASNRFFGCTAESNTRDLENNNSYSEFYGCVLGVTGNMVLTQNPMIWMGGYDGSVQPTLFPYWKRNMSSASVDVNGTTLTANAINLGVGSNSAHSSTIAGTFGAIAANGNTKTLNLTFNSALATTTNATVVLDVKFTGYFDNWNASGLKQILTTFGVPDPKTSSIVVVDTNVLTIGGIGSGTVVTRTGLTCSPSVFSSVYTFNAASSATSPVHYSVTAYVYSASTSNTNAFTLSWT